MPPILTFVSKSFAKKGFRFYYEGPHSDCPKDCQIYATCQQNPKPKTVYEVMEVLNRELNCPKDYHEEPMVLVKLIIPEMEVAMENRDIFEGSVVNYVPINCENEDCPNIEYCTPNELMFRRNEKVKILERLRKITDCPKNKAISIVRVEKRE